MSRRSLARILAPLALLAAVTAVAVVVSDSGRGDGSQPAATVRTTTSGRVITGPVASSTTATTPRGGAGAYTIKAGDTLSTVAQRTGLTVERLQQLNPSVDSGALRVGQQLKLRPGAKESKP